MNKNIKLAVAGAVLALSATAANAGIIIPAGEWTLDINGNVNGYANWTSVDTNTGTTGSAIAVAKDANNKSNAKSIQTGLLPAWIGFTGKTRQNDLDVEFTISMQPGVSSDDITGDSATGVNGSNNVGGQTRASFLNRQTYLSFGDKSWGSIKIGKDLGIYASDAILNDMTLLGLALALVLALHLTLLQVVLVLAINMLHGKVRLLTQHQTLMAFKQLLVLLTQIKWMVQLVYTNHVLV